ncbi:family 20 glycosylhydrolase [Candidatus Bathyarchaeota archaeon]|nr:family 20 glycosylhydrolase [Candidatus Bathyarchaeota archaeon]
MPPNRNRYMIHVIPRPVLVHELQGALDPSSLGTILVEGEVSSINSLARKFLEDILEKELCILSMDDDLAKTGIEGYIMLSKDDNLAKTGNEGYILDVKKEGVSIRARDARGLFYGVQTTRQLAWGAKNGISGSESPRNIPCVRIVDFPRFQWRGFMLDVSRHFFDVETVKQLLDAMALLKLNKFHLHLTDDQGWRIQVDRYPKLSTIGSNREESQTGGFLSRKSDGKPHGGFFTKGDIKEILEHASNRYIQVIPEIEMPGHCTAALASYPELSCTGGPFKVATTSGIKKDVYCAGKEKVYRFLEGVLDEIVALFPSPVIHIGGDEAPRKRWKNCADCQAMIESKELDNEDELQAFFTSRMVEYLESKGRKAMGWNEMLRGGFDKDAVVQYWLKDKKHVLNHLRHGGKAVMSHFFHVYLDYNHGVIPLSKTYEYDPIPKKLKKPWHGNVLGIEAPMWTEFAEDRHHVHVFVFPRLIAVAENAWTPRSRKDFKSFTKRLSTVQEMLSRLGIECTPLDLAEPKGLKKLLLKIKIYKQSSELPS